LYPLLLISKQDFVPVEKIVIEKVSVSPKLDDSLFAKPVLTTAANATHHGLDISPRLQAAARGDILLHNLGGR
jgi:hypothetical protein